MSEPTKEQIEKVLAIGRRFETGLMAHRLAEEIANLLAAETAPLHEKIARLTEWNAAKAAEADELREKLAAALAPSAHECGRISRGDSQ